MAMKRSSWRHVIAAGAVVAVAGGAIALANQGCSSSSKTATSGNTTPPATCPNSTLTLAFDHAYSAYIPGSMHTFQIPFGVLELPPSVNSSVMWSASDPSKVSFSPGSVDFGTGPAYANAMVTTQGSGQVYIVATMGSQCGAAVLNISEATESDWQIGSGRYNMGTLLMQVSTGQLEHLDGGDQAACTSCHGPTAMGASYKTVEHTPEQTGGFTDDDLIGIFTMGMVPPGGTFDSTIVRQTTWSRFHQWAMTPDQARGVVVYLRSLTPAPQMGMSNLPPRNYDGGFGGGSGGSSGGGSSSSGSSSGGSSGSGSGSGGGDASSASDSSAQGDATAE
jgi:hypothetical protein